MLDLSDFYKKTADETASLTLDLTLKLREKATMAEWSPDVVASLTVEYSEGSLDIAYPDVFDKQVEDLEYGTSDNPPKAVIRPFMDDEMAEANDALLEVYIDYLTEKGYLL